MEAQLFLLEVSNLCCCEICSIKQVSHEAGLKLTTDEQNVTYTESKGTDLGLGLTKHESESFRKN